MEWKRVKNWLIVLLAAADLILAFSVGRQLLQRRNIVRAATENAVAVAQKRGIRLESEAVFAMPEKTESYRTERSDTMESGAALKLLGENELIQPGGGVTIYTGEAGEVSFRRGGALEIRLRDRAEAEPVALLESAGLPVEGVSLMVDGGESVLYQRQDGLPVFNCQLTCRGENGGFAARGRWLLAEELTPEESSIHRAQLVLALCDLLEERGLDRVNGLEAGYYLQSEDARAMLLIPVWAVETSQGRLYLNCLTGEQLIF